MKAFLLKIVTEKCLTSEINSIRSSNVASDKA